MKNIHCIILFLFWSLLVGPSTLSPYVAQAQPSAMQKPPKKIALLVGIDHYWDKANISELHGCLNDVKLMSDVLSGPNFRFNTVNVLPEQQATRNGIIDAFKNLIAAAKLEKAQHHPEAAVLFYFSGHGSTAVDRDHDEIDGYDETIVPIDATRVSTAKTGFDLRDDDLYALFSQLSLFTRNITFILDSCHSGTATRAPSGIRQVEQADRRNYPPPVVRSGAVTHPTESLAVDMLPSGGSYVTISACAAQQLAREEEFLMPNGQREFHGDLTYYLAQELKNLPRHTTYLDLQQRLQVLMGSRVMNQSPQIEGELHRAVLGDPLSSDVRPLKIMSGSLMGRKFRIPAGLAGGVSTGTMLALYGAKAVDWQGSIDKIGEARVVSAQPFFAEAEAIGDFPLSLTDKVVIVTPGLDSEPLPVSLNFGLTRAEKDPLDAQVKAEIQNLLAPPNEKFRALVRITPTNSLTAAPRIKVCRATFHQIYPDSPLPFKAQEQGYYLTDSHSVPLLESFFVPVTDTHIASKLVVALEKLSKQRNVLSISNATASNEIRGKIKLTIIRHPGKVVNGTFSATSAPFKLSSQSTNHVGQGARLKVRMTNTSSQPLYLSLIDISPDGAIHPLFGSNEPPLQPGASVETKRLRIEGAAGIETFKVIATTEPADFTFLNQSAVQRRAVKNSLLSDLQQIFDEAAGGKRAVFDSKFDLVQWTTAQIQILVQNRFATN